MKIGVFLNYTGLGSNLLHLSYCHQIAKKYGPVNIITICKGLKDLLDQDPLIKEVIVFDKNKKTILDIFNLTSFLKKMKLDKIFIYYPSQRIFWAAKLSGIQEIKYYRNISKKNLHLVNTAKKFTIENLNLEQCPTETTFFISEEQKKIGKKIVNVSKYNIILGIGSSGPSTKWSTKNYIELINQLNKKDDFYFYLLCGQNEKNISEEIYKFISKKNCKSLHSFSIKDLLPILSLSNMYIGNDSFGHHITSQLNIPSIILLFDTPRAYSDYSVNQYRILPEGVSIDQINHDSVYNPNTINVGKVIQKVFDLKKLT